MLRRPAGARLMSLGTAFSLLLSSCQSLGIPLEGCSENGCPIRAKVCVKPTMHALACDLDCLEKHIDRYGSVVAQQPSVWGQARLTKHREEFEQQMAAQLSAFHATLQGSLSQSDQAYLADALALSFTAQAAASKSSGGGGPLGDLLAGCKAAPPTASASSSASSSSGGDGGSGKSGGGGSSDGSLTLPPAFGAFENITRTPTRLAGPLGFANIGQGGVSLEPVVYLDQMKRYLDHLHELRRINEGDDTADSPGYALNLVRIPVSVLPGNRTDVGFGAEITFTLRPHLHDELLPMTFRNLVMNDLLEQLGVPLTQFVNDPVGEAMLDEWANENLTLKKDAKGNDKLALNSVNDLGGAKKFVEDRLKNLPTRALMRRLWSYYANPNFAQLYDDYRNELENFTIPVLGFVASPRRRALHGFPTSQIIDIYGARNCISVASVVYNICGSDLPNRDITHYTDVQAYLVDEIGAAYKFLQTPQANGLWTEFCCPELAQAVHNRQVDLIERWRCCFEDRCKSISATSKKDSTEVRNWAHKGYQRKSGRSPSDPQCQDAPKNDKDQDITTIWAWSIIVDSALLNDQLVRDMKEAAAARGCCQLPTDWLPYFHPCPPPEARQAFNEYVQCRWPIHVFALDPVTDQQNIADTFSSRREMQLAVSLAFVSGKVNANNLLRYARRLETEIETIALNSTAVGFSHGTDVFGWRFYPRFQTPDTPGNATAFFQDLVTGGPNKNARLRQRRLEPGIRECVAIVLMPSFVSYADMDACSNWFHLTKPKCKVMDSADAVRLSEKVKSIELCAHQVGNADCCRDGELGRLYSRAEQLEARLPLQSMSVQVPFENTLGGFAMFNTGLTDLAPELLGWYGAPAINLDGSTTLFLIGNHFSVHQTRVLAGGQEVVGQQMLSRQVMKVTVPAGALALEQDTGIAAGCVKPASADAAHASGEKPLPEGLGPDRLFVDVQLATPYGVSSHLLIPACHFAKSGADSGPDGGGAAGPAAASSPAWTTKELTLGFVYKGLGIAACDPPRYRPTELAIDLNALRPFTDKDTVTLKMKLGGGAKGQVQDLAVSVSAASYDYNKRVLKIAGADLDRLVNYLFTALQMQFGPDETNAPCPVTVAETTVIAPNTPARKLNNALRITWVKASDK